VVCSWQLGRWVLPLSKLGYRRYQIHQLTRQERNFNVSGEQSLAERAAAKGLGDFRQRFYPSTPLRVQAG